MRALNCSAFHSCIFCNSGWPEFAPFSMLKLGNNSSSPGAQPHAWCYLEAHINFFYLLFPNVSRNIHQTFPPNHCYGRDQAGPRCLEGPRPLHVLGQGYISGPGHAGGARSCLHSRRGHKWSQIQQQRQVVLIYLVPNSIFPATSHKLLGQRTSKVPSTSPRPL